mgnify:CR=1 FL=1
MGVRTVVKDMWERLTGVEAAANAAGGERKTTRLPSIFTPYNQAGRTVQSALPNTTPAQTHLHA